MLLASAALIPELVPIRCLVFAAAGRGYRYLPPDSEDVILPAFHGLSYTRFNISAPTAPATIDSTLTLPVEVANTGEPIAFEHLRALLG